MPVIRTSNLSKLFDDEVSFGQAIFLIEIGKKGWMFGTISISEFSKYIDLMKNQSFRSLFPHIMGCFRLSQMFEVSADGFKQIADLISVVLNQCVASCDLVVPSKLLTLSQTYFRQKETGEKEYLLDHLKKQRIFMMREFWECYLVWSALNSVQENSRGVNSATLRNNLDEKIGSVFLSVIFEMTETGVEKQMVKDLILSYSDRFRLSEKNRQQVALFLAQYNV
jgi:hypothetical protein